MHLFPLIPSILTKISILVLGIEKRGGGWWYGRSNDCAVWSNLNGIYPYCRKETWADIHWKNLDPNNPKGSAPTSTEMKIRPVDFF